MATYEVNGPGGAVYQIDGPEGADPSALVQAASGQAKSAPNPNAAQGALGELALGGRDIGEGVFDTLNGPADLGKSLIVNPARNLINRVFGTHLAPAPLYSNQLSDALTASGAPVPTTSNEKFAASVIKGSAGALTGLGVMGMASPLNALRAGVAGATGGASSDLARQAGAGPLGQFAAGLAGGFVPSALEGAIAAPVSFARPLTRAGQQQLAANTLLRETQNPQAAAANLQNAQPLVPGSLRTTGEASGDTGLLNLEKGIRARNAGAFAARISSQNAARQAELAQLGGTPADVAAAEQLRDATTAPMRQNAFRNAQQFAPTNPPPPKPSAILDSSGQPFAPPPAAPSTAPTLKPVTDTIDSILSSPAGARESISKTMKWAKGLIGDNTDPEALYEVRKDLALAQRDRLQPTGRDAPNVSMLGQARGELGKVISALDDSIESVAPGYKAYLAKYSDLSQPIDQMEAIQGLQQKASSGLDTATGHPFLSAPSFDRGLQGILARTQGSIPLRMTPAQLQRLEAVRQDALRGNALSSPTVRAPGSDTFQNFMRLSRISNGFLGHVPVLGKYLRGVNDFVDQRVNEQLSNAMLDPQLAAKLLQQGVLKSSLARTIGKRMLPYSAAAPALLPSPQRGPLAIPQFASSVPVR